MRQHAKTLLGKQGHTGGITAGGDLYNVLSRVAVTLGGVQRSGATSCAAEIRQHTPILSYISTAGYICRDQ